MDKERRYLRTEIDELDEMLGIGQEHSENKNGIPSGSVLLIRGEPGSGKTTLALQIMNAFLSGKNSRGYLISLEENGQDLVARVADTYTFPSLAKKSGDGNMRISSRLTCNSVSEVHEWIQAATAESFEEKLDRVGDALSNAAEAALGVFNPLNPAATALKGAALIAKTPKMARMITGLFEKHSATFTRTLADNEHCLLIVDSLNAFLNIATEYFPDKRHPRVILNTFCRALRETFGERTTVILTGEYHYEQGIVNVAAESFLCDVEIVLRPEPVRVPESYEAGLQAPLGYNLNALISDKSESIECRSFCRVMKSRSTPNQSRRCAYDIVAREGLKFYPTYPGDGKLVLFAENQPQRESWTSFFDYDVPDSYPALRTNVFDRNSLQTIFEGQRRLRNVPLRTDMYLASFDSYWVTWFQRFRLKAEIERSIESRTEGRRPAVTHGTVPQLVNSLMRLLNGPPIKGELTWENVAIYMSISYFGELIDAIYDDKTWDDWVKKKQPGNSKDSKFLGEVNRLSKDFSQASFLTPLEFSKLKLHGEGRSDIIEELASSQNSKEQRYFIPYDANIGVFVYRKDFLEQADLEEADAVELLTGIVKREQRMCEQALAHLYAEVYIESESLNPSLNFQELAAAIPPEWRPDDSASPADWTDCAANMLKELYPVSGAAPPSSDDRSEEFFILKLLDPASKGRRNYRFRIAPRTDLGALRDSWKTAISSGGPVEKSDALLFDSRVQDEKLLKGLNDALTDPRVRAWLLRHMGAMNPDGRWQIAEVLEMACRILELRDTLRDSCSKKRKDFHNKMIQAAAMRIREKKPPQTWEEVIVTARMLGRPVQIEWQTFDSFVCSFLEVLWSCGGTVMKVDEDYQISFTRPEKKDKEPSDPPQQYSAHINPAWADGFVQMLRACHIMHELYWQRIVPKSAVTTHKPRAFHRGVAGSKDWVFARHWYSTLMDLLTSKGEDGELLYPDDPQMRLKITKIPISLTAWADDICVNKGAWEKVQNCKAGHAYCSDRGRREKDSAEQAKPAENEEKWSVCEPLPPGNACGAPNDTRQDGCPGCPRPVSFSCWGEWNFGLVSGAENKALAIDLVNNMMSSIKVLERAFSGACIPTVKAFYEMYGELPCVSVPERNEETLPDITYKRLREDFFTNAKSRKDICDFRHCGKILHSKLEHLRKAPGKMPEVEIIRLCTEIFLDIKNLYSFGIMLEGDYGPS